MTDCTATTNSTQTEVYYLTIDAKGHQYGPSGPYLKKGLNSADDFEESDEKNYKYGKGGYYVHDAKNVLEYLVHTRSLCMATIPTDALGNRHLIKLPDGRIRTNMLEIINIYDMHKIETFEILKKLGTNLRINRDAPLKWALSNGLIDIAEFLIGEDAQMTLLQYASTSAAGKGFAKVVEMIRNKGNGFDDVADITAALHNGHLPVILYLETRGAVIPNFNEALVWACRCGYTDIVTHILTKNHDINFRCGEPLKMAARYGHLDTVKILISNGADVKINNGVALHQAKIQGHTCIAAELANAVTV